MRYTVLEGVRNLVQATGPDPIPDGIRPIIRVEAVGICGSDLHYWEAGEAPGIILGHEFAGTIVDPGDRKDLKPGDRVTCLSSAPCLECGHCRAGFDYRCTNQGKAPGILHQDHIGAYAEYFVPLKSAYVYKIADHVSFDDASMCEPAAVTRRAVEQVGCVKKGDRVVVAGGGIIGAMMIQWCRYFGAGYIALTETNPSRAELVMNMGYADAWFDAKDPDVAQKLLRQTPQGYDIFFDCTGNPAAINLGLGVIRLEGTEVWVGCTFDQVPVNHLAAIFRQAIIRSTIGFSIPTFESCLSAITDGTFPISQYHTGDATFDTMQSSFAELLSPENSHFKIILHPHKSYRKPGSVGHSTTTTVL